jgi:hypothetical protein
MFGSLSMGTGRSLCLYKHQLRDFLDLYRTLLHGIRSFQNVVLSQLFSRRRLQAVSWQVKPHNQYRYRGAAEPGLHIYCSF